MQVVMGRGESGGSHGEGWVQSPWGGVGIGWGPHEDDPTVEMLEGYRGRCCKWAQEALRVLGN